MLTDRFSIKEALKLGWETTKGNFLFFFLVLVITILIGVLPDLVGFFLGISDPTRLPLVMAIIALVALIAWFFLWLAMQLGLVKIALRFCDGEKGKYADLFTNFSLVPKYFIASILYGLIVLGGMILLIIPGVIWAIQFGYFFYVMVDRGGTGIMDSLKESSRITKGARQKIFMLILALIGVNVLGAIPLGLGLLVTIPTTMVAYASVFRRLSGKLDISCIPVPSEKPAAAPMKTAAKPKRKEEAQRRPSSPGEEWRNRGLNALLRDEFEEAAEALSRAVEMDPGYGAAYHSRGFAYYRLGRYEQAKNDFDRAIELDKDYAEDAGTYMYRGLTLERLGERQQAIEDMKLAVSLGNRGADKWLVWLTEGKDSQ